MKVLHYRHGARLSGVPQFGVEESLTLKRKLLLSLLAVVPAVFMPLAAAGKIIPERKHVVEENQPSYKYEVFAGFGYTSLNQVNNSRSGLMGADISLTRDWGKYFGITADGAYYKYAYKGGNPGTPSVDRVLFGPVVHADLYERVGVFAHALLGGAHTGGESMTPTISFAGGVGGGLEYRLSKHMAVRASGDYIASSFSLAGNSPNLGYSPHKHWNSSASAGIVYKF
jgi:opacity protein-like surface antigen